MRLVTALCGRNPATAELTTAAAAAAAELTTARSAACVSSRGIRWALSGDESSGQAPPLFSLLIVAAVQWARRAAGAGRRPGRTACIAGQRRRSGSLERSAGSSADTGPGQPAVHCALCSGEYRARGRCTAGRPLRRVQLVNTPAAAAPTNGTER